MSSDKSGGTKPSSNTWFDKSFEGAIDWLIRNDTPHLTLCDLLNRYIDEHGENNWKDLVAALNIDDKRLRRYRVDRKVRPQDYKDIIKFCIFFELDKDTALEVLKNCGHPEENFAGNRSKAAHYAILRYPGCATISEWNEYLKQHNYQPLDDQ